MTIKGKGDMETWFLLGNNERTLPGQETPETTPTAHITTTLPGHETTDTNEKVSNNMMSKPPGENFS